MHIPDAGLYDLRQESGFAHDGGNLEAWLAHIVAQGRLAEPSLHASAAHILGRGTDGLWPAPGGADAAPNG
jgi:hypothetical protein